MRVVLPFLGNVPAASFPAKQPQGSRRSRFEAVKQVGVHRTLFIDLYETASSQTPTDPIALMYSSGGAQQTTAISLVRGIIAHRALALRLPRVHFLCAGHFWGRARWVTVFESVLT